MNDNSLCKFKKEAWTGVSYYVCCFIQFFVSLKNLIDCIFSFLRLKIIKYANYFRTTFCESIFEKLFLKICI